MSLRLLMTADAVGGVWTYALDLCAGLAPHGVEVLLATMGDAPRSSQRERATRLKNVRLEVSTFKLEWMDNPWDDVAAAGEWLTDLARDFSPDVVHLNGYAHGALPWNAPVVMVAHSCVLSWWEAVKGEPAPPSWSRYRDEVTAGIKGADLVVAPTRAMLQSARRHYVREAELPTRVIPNGRDGQGYRADQKKEPVILAAGRVWDEAKNLTVLSEASKQIPWPVRIAGSAVSPDGRRAEMGRVEMLGHLPPERLAAQLQRAAIYALPAKYEPFGLSALEAALCGCALVLGDIPSLREVWEDSALFVPPDDADALAQAISILMQDRVLRDIYVRKSTKRAAQYSQKRSVESYLAAYREVTTVWEGAKARKGLPLKV